MGYTAGSIIKTMSHRAKKKILVLGASSRLGMRLCPSLKSLGFQVLTAGRDKGLEYPIATPNFENIRRLLNIVLPDHVINLIAATSVDDCERDAGMAVRVNTLIPAEISAAVIACEKRGVHLLHVSTDQVYDGHGNHLEEDASPINMYGLSKWAGELLMDKERTVVLRTNFFGKSMIHTRPLLSDWVVKSLGEGKKVTLFKDIRFSALHVSSLCEIIASALDQSLIGTYNVGCRDGISKADFALSLAAELSLSTYSATVGYSEESPLRAKRPSDMTMSVRKIEHALGITCPYFSEEIYKTAREYVNV